MKKFIYVLLLYICTVTCLNTRQSNDSSTTGDKKLESKESKLDNFRQRLLNFIVGIMIIAFTFTCFCLIHYNCMIDDAITKKKTLQKENMEAVASWVSKVSAYQHDIPDEYTLEKEPLLLNTEWLCEPSSPEKLPMPLNSEKSIKAPSLEGSTILCSAKKIVISTIPEKSSIPYSSKELIRQPSPKMTSCSSNRKKSHRSYHFKNLYRKRSLKKLRKINHAHRLVSQVRASCPNKSIMLPWLAILQSSANFARASPPPFSQKEIVSSKQSSLKKTGKSHGYHHVKKSVNISNAAVLPTPRSAKTCPYKERCLLCNSSDTLVNNISDAKKENTESHHESNKLKCFFRSFYEADSKDNVYNDNLSNGDMTADGSSDSDEEIIIFCDMNHKDTIPKDTSDN